MQATPHDRKADAHQSEQTILKGARIAQDLRRRRRRSERPRRPRGQRPPMLVRLRLHPDRLRAASLHSRRSARHRRLLGEFGRWVALRRLVGRWVALRRLRRR